MKRTGYGILFGIICLLTTGLKEAHATHAAGMDMFYRWTQDSTYEFTIIFYKNCAGPTAGPPFSMSLRSRAASISQDFTTTISRMPTSGSGVPPLQPPNMYNCTEASNLCYEEYVYRGNWTSRGRAQDWTFSTTVCCRPGPALSNNPPTNIAYTAQWLECGLNNLDFPDQTAQNWSPLWHNRRPNHPGYTTDTVINFLFRTLCMGNYYTLDQSVREYQGDSVTYEFFVPQGTGGANVTYINGWNFNTPLPTQNGPLTINPNTGVIPIVPGQPTGTGIYVIGIKAREWRYDTIASGGAFIRVAKEIGWNNRDMTIWIDDTSTCRRDSVHPKDIVVNLTGKQEVTEIDVFFSTGNSNDPNSLVRCETISPDGSEFRILDSSNYIAPFDTTVRSIGVHKATWTCQAGLTEKVTLHLAEPLKCQDYTLMLKKGTDLDVLESECGFLEPEFTTGVLTVTKDVQVEIDTVGTLLSYCLPTENPFPKLRASSNDTSSFPLEYSWAYKCPGCPDYDTIEGQDIAAMWAKTSGHFKVMVKDPRNCLGDDVIQVVYDTVPEFVLDIPPYCDVYGELPGMPDSIKAPEHSDITQWRWFNNTLGASAGVGEWLKSPNLIEGQSYSLIGTKPPIIPGAQPCSTEFEFFYSRDSFPPQDPLFVTFFDDGIALCVTDDDTGSLAVWESGLRQKFSPLFPQWYKDTVQIPGTGYTLKVTDTGRYIVMVQDTLGCWGRDTAWVTSDERLNGPVVPCTVSGASGIFTFIWPEEYPEGIQNEVSLDGGATWIPASNGSYHTVFNVENQKFIKGRGVLDWTACYYTDESTSLECPDEVFPPNVMTPNGDGLNDLFEIDGLELYANSKVEVYDRWGNVVFSSDNYKNDWDGGDLPEGTYYYILEVDDPQETVHRGILTILR